MQIFEKPSKDNLLLIHCRGSSPLLAEKQKHREEECRLTSLVHLNRDWYEWQGRCGIFFRAKSWDLRVERLEATTGGAGQTIFENTLYAHLWLAGIDWSVLS